jgi:predicted amidohydrolase YtcJ
MADIVILNGSVITFDGRDAEALAITGDTIEAVGTTAEIRNIAGSAQVIDAAGATVMPGFIDSHVHLFGGSAELDCMNLAGCEGEQSIAEAIRNHRQSLQGDEVMLAASIDYHAFGSRAITRHDLDRVAPDIPFAAIAADHHTVWANTKALTMAGLINGASVPEGSEVVMAEDGTAGGELRETGAFGPVLALTAYGGRDLAGYVSGKDPQPPATAAQRTRDKAVIARGLEHCASYGITGLHNMDGNFYQLELLSELLEERKLLCRTEVPMHLKGTDSLDRLSEAEAMRQQYNSDYLWSRRVKMFMDGVIDSRTAYMLNPYPGTNSGSEALFTPEQFNEACTIADAKKLQIAVHAIGDAAVRQTLDGYQAARNTNGARDSRHRIEHIEVIDEADIPRFAELGVVASMQPLHSPAGGLFPPYEPDGLVHKAQIPRAFAWRTLRANSAKLIFSTDWPVVPVDTMLTVKGAVAGANLPPEWPDQRQSLRETLASYTKDNAWVEFNENKKGRLRAGMMADVVVMDCDLESQPPEMLDQAKAVHTICGGRITFQR